MSESQTDRKELEAVLTEYIRRNHSLIRDLATEPTPAAREELREALAVALAAAVEKQHA